MSVKADAKETNGIKTVLWDPPCHKTYILFIIMLLSETIIIFTIISVYRISYPLLYRTNCMLIGVGFMATFPQCLPETRYRNIFIHSQIKDSTSSLIIKINLL